MDLEQWSKRLAVLLGYMSDTDELAPENINTKEGNINSQVSPESSSIQMITILHVGWIDTNEL